MKKEILKLRKILDKDEILSMWLSNLDKITVEDIIYIILYEEQIEERIMNYEKITLEFFNKLGGI